MSDFLMMLLMVIQCFLFSLCLNMSRVMRKPEDCICENEGADQLRGYFTAKLFSAFVFAHIRNFKPIAIFCDCTARFVADQAKNPEDRFSHKEAHILLHPCSSITSRAARVDDRLYMYLCNPEIKPVKQLFLEVIKLFHSCSTHLSMKSILLSAYSC